GKLIVNEDEADVVRLIFERYLDGMSTAKLADELARKEIPTKHGGKWSSRTVSGILRNPVHCGYLVWDGIVRKGKHEPIIDIGIFENVRERLNEKRKRNRHQEPPSLQGLDLNEERRVFTECEG
ncbi:MAG: recombinase family protein, partial [Thermoplasmata archaeon]|nr:recombinase family protein [Thermoplasmata archaeon]